MTASSLPARAAPVSSDETVEAKSSRQTTERRERRLRLAVFTSMGSKMVTLGLQFFAIPVAIRSVSQPEFGVYAVMAALLSFLSLSDFGLGPALTRRMAEAHSRGEMKLAGSTLASGFALVAGTVGLLWLGWWFMDHSSMIESWSAKSGVTSEMLLSVLAVGSAQVLANPFLRAQAGLQELYINNLFVAGGTLLATVALFLVATHAPSARNFLLAVYGPVAALQLGNAAYFIIRHRYLLEPFPRPSWNLAKPLMKDGLLFAVPQTVGPMVLRESPKLVLFHLGLASITASYAVLIQVLLLVSGVVFMFTQPLLPALIDAQARGDQNWVATTRRRGLQTLLGFAVLFVIGFLSVGPTALSLYSGGRFQFDRATLLIFALYGSLMLWNHLGFIFASAAGRLGLYFRFSLVELSVFGFCLGFFRPHTLVGFFLSLALAFLPTALFWPRLLYSRQQTRFAGTERELRT